uniref:Integrase catalytic domain-containing protein n=1 Tax=Tanacetum cinerariifolium TaxID=118510 RepID=A0A6L2MUA7_TANCI|nr:hypothetical protein [Tanacetum cinerariifolium]
MDAPLSLNHTFDFFAAEPMPGLDEATDNQNGWIEWDVPLGGEMDEPMEKPRFDEEEELDKFMDDDEDVGGPSTATFVGHTLTTMASGVAIQPQVIDDLCVRMSNLEYRHGELVKKMVKVSNAEVADSIIIREIYPRVATMVGQVHVMASHAVHVVSRLEKIKTRVQQVESRVDTYSSAQMENQQLRTRVAKMESREGTLMSYMLWMEERLTVLEKRLLGPPSGTHQKKSSELLFMASGGSDQNAEYALSKLLQMGTVAEYESEFVILENRVTGISSNLLKSFYISELELELQRELFRSRPTTLGEAFSFSYIAEAHFENERSIIAIAKLNELTVNVHIQDLEQTTQGRWDEPNRILLVTIHHMIYPITVEVLNQIFSPHGYVEKVIIFQKSAHVQENCFSILNAEEAGNTKSTLSANTFGNSGVDESKTSCSETPEKEVVENGNGSALIFWLDTIPKVRLVRKSRLIAVAEDKTTHFLEPHYSPSSILVLVILLVEEYGIPLSISLQDNTLRARYAWTRFLKTKNEAFEKFEILSRKIQNQLGSSIIAIRTDHGREFDNEVQFGAYCDALGITYNFSAPRTPQSNGVVERKNMTLQEMSRTMLNEQCISQKFWCNAVDTSTYILDRILIRPILGKNPYEIFKGYSQNSNAYVVKVEESLNVTFDESPPPTKLSPLVYDDVGEEDATRKNAKIENTNNEEDESIEVEEIVNIKESKNHPLD